MNTLKTAPQDLCPLTHASKEEEIAALDALLHRASIMALHLSAQDEEPEEVGGYNILTAFRARAWVQARVEKSFGPLRHPDTEAFAHQEAKRLGRTLETSTPQPPAAPTPITYEATRTSAHDRIRALHQKGTSLRKIVQALESEGIRGPHGGSWHVTSIRRVLSTVA